MTESHDRDTAESGVNLDSILNAGISRRATLRGGMLGAAGVMGAGLLGACSTGGGGDKASATGATTAAASSAAAGDYKALKGKKVGMIGINLTSEANNRARVEGEKIAKAEGIDFTAVDTQGDYKKASDTLKLWADQDYAAVVSNVVDPNLISEGAAALGAKKIPFGGIFSGNGPNLTFDTTANEWISGCRIGTYIAQRIIAGGGGGLAIIGLKSLPPVLVRELAITAMMDYYKIPILDRHEIKYPGQVPDAKQVTADWLTKYKKGGKLKAIWGGWDELGNAASQQIKQLGRDDVFTAAMDGNLQSFDAIRAGDPMSATCANDMELITQVCMQQLSTVVAGSKAIAESIYVDSPFISKENCPPKGQFPTIGTGLNIYYKS